MAQDDCNPSPLEKQQINNLSMEELSDKFKISRAVDEVCKNKWGSAFHLIMQQLGVRLGNAGTPKGEIIKWLGPPDSQTTNFSTVKLNAGEEILIYHWRSWHDWLYFVIENNRVKKGGWWFAYE